MRSKNAPIAGLIGPNDLVFSRVNSVIAAKNVYPFSATNRGPNNESVFYGISMSYIVKRYNLWQKSSESAENVFNGTFPRSHTVIHRSLI